MQRWFSFTFAVLLLATPLAQVAASATSSQEGADSIPVYLFASEEGEIVGIVPMTEQVLVLCMLSASSTTGVVNPEEIAQGVECALWDSESGSTTPLTKEGAGVEHAIMGARYYAGSVGRFVSQDPAFLDIGDSSFGQRYARTLEQHLTNPQALNSYTYSLNNPVAYLDPQGEIVPLALIGAMAFFGASMNILTQSIADFVVGQQSSPETYVGQGVGGAVGGPVGLITGPFTAGAVTAGTSNLTTQLLEGRKTGDSIDFIQVGTESLKGGATSKASTLLKIPSLSKGSNSWKATSNSTFTKTINGTIANISGKTAAKMTGYGAYAGIPGLAVTVTERYTQYSYTDRSGNTSSSRVFNQNSSKPRGCLNCK